MAAKFCLGEEQTEVTLVLFNSVSNSDEIKDKLIKGQIQATFINPKTIIDKFQVLVAVNKALHCRTRGAMKTKNVYSEILYGLSPAKNITRSLKTFGINDSDSEVLAVILDDRDDGKLREIRNEVRGIQNDVELLCRIGDESLIKKIYGIKDVELNVGSILDSIVSRISAKDYT
ncbi:EKC/KEOPS complex subunit TPRKB-like [Centruroides vittatus]|uniref:EKC/KEOPS complex subunit TPRKB-like n=1 Tax=Centruroides vittatus TaxID=120091 RepID=UPI00350FA799